MSQIGNNIKKLRKVKGLSQQAFAELFGLTRGNISSYEEFRAEPRIEVILQIAKYFSIPVAELLEKQLTVNEILNFEDYFVEEKGGKNTKNLAQIPFLGREAFQVDQGGIGYLADLPQIYFPAYSKSRFMAVENSSFIPRPVSFPFEENAVLFFEHVEVDILHTLHKHFGLYLKGDVLFFGQYEVEGKDIELVLNDWKKVSFTAEEAECFWKLYAKFEKVF
ncbi:helix-turn-helix transcriptional regulator [Sphingobacterium alkalisoli]|uniref:Helix-turn-helix transcriptional regulator n=1 Tax=Sphingobacterium alkalisoli TaxID=1874115 RepID=A0A4U0GYZ8_9SPHI|nr:helix-turn-helix transcriptional regulator [Sphingobacterium alkalisoli]TJY64413.1 helix-turn-helix transcriptional regulator [Sphingobacterium alkalisoli]GGH21906.1 hypothetical protein GCM10011418_28100 [Sphingobacterium alkalisoli]